MFGMSFPCSPQLVATSVRPSVCCSDSGLKIDNGNLSVEENEIRSKTTFVVNVVNHDGGGIGAVLRKSGGIFVTDVHKDGLIGNWNNANLSCAVKVGDRLLSVNDSEHDAEMRNAFERVGPLKLVFQRNTSFIVTLKKDGERLGMKLKRSRRADELTVTEIGQGRCKEWNECHADKQVKVGDVVVAVNGFRKASHMMKQIVEEDQVEFIFYHVDLSKW